MTHVQYGFYFGKGFAAGAWHSSREAAERARVELRERGVLVSLLYARAK